MAVPEAAVPEAAVPEVAVPEVAVLEVDVLEVVVPDTASAFHPILDGFYLFLSSLKREKEEERERVGERVGESKSIIIYVYTLGEERG